MLRRIIAVTGASGSIGAAVCRELSSSDCQVALHCNLNIRHASGLLNELRQKGCEGKVYSGDLSTTEAAVAFVDAVSKDFGSIDVLVNNAGVAVDGLLLSLTDGAVARILTTNVMSAITVSREAARLMVSNRRGVIVNISSAAARVPSPGQSAYAASKAALEGLTRALAIELAPRNVRVNCVAPGYIEGGMTTRLNQSQRRRAIERIALRRFGDPHDVAAAVAFLASERSEYITGHVLEVSGGIS